jgi:hypothetical protein
VHRPAFTVTFVAEKGVNAIRSFRALLKSALRRHGLHAVDVRELQPNAQTREQTMTSEFAKRVRAARDKGLFKVADFVGGKELTLTITYLLEEVEMFEKTVDLLNFQETGRQLQLNQTTAEWLIDNLGDDPEEWPGQQVTLYLGTYEYNKETKHGIRLRLPDIAPSPKAEFTPEPDIDDDVPFH